jgi:mannosyltransferase
MFPSSSALPSLDAPEAPRDGRFFAALSGARRAQLVAAAIIAVAAVIRLAAIDRGLWFDELASLTFARQPLGSLWGEWMLRETNPPLFYTLLKGWGALFGSSDAVAHGLPIVIGLAGIGAMFLPGRAIGGSRAGLLGAALLALSAAHADYSLQLRGYGLGHSAVLFACLAMVRFLQERAPRHLLLYVGAAAVALYSHTMLVVFVLLANAAMLALLRKDRAAIARWIAANALLALAWSWWGWMTLRQLAGPHSPAWIVSPTPGEAWQVVKTAFLPLYVRSSTSGGDLLLAIMAGGVAWFAILRRRGEIGLLAALALGAPVVLLAISEITPVLVPRTLYWASGPFTALLPAAIAGIADRRVSAIVAAALIALSAIGLAAWFPERQTEQWPSAAATLANDARGLPILVADDSVALALAHYLPEASDRILILEVSGAPHEHWARGLFQRRRVDAAGARQLLQENCRIAVLLRGFYNPSLVLAAAGGRAMAIGSGAQTPLTALWGLPGRRCH